MKSLEYQLNCGQYVLYADGKPTTAPQDEIALALSAEAGVLHKHGKPEMVAQWVAQTREKLLRAAEGNTIADRRICEAMARDLVVLQGRFLLDELNKCITCSGYVARLYEQAKVGTLGSLDRWGKPVKS
jgi:hypothetical protein